MRRMKHAVRGMVAGWLAPQMLLIAVMVVVAALQFVRRGMPSQDWSYLIFFLGIFAACSAVVCLGAWLLFYLPVYWYWPRDGGWSRGAFTTVGVLSAGLIGLVSVLAARPYQPFWAAVVVIALPAFTGGLSALIGWGSEENERRYLEWQKQVTSFT